jgi:hypothetical protein
MNADLNPYDYANIFTIYEDESGQMYFNLINDLSIEGDIDPSLYNEIFYNQNDSWYDLSNRYYGTTRLWWTILVANNIINPFKDVKTGDRLKILKKEVISDILAQINSSNNE